jgi:hypothetical protein
MLYLGYLVQTTNLSEVNLFECFISVNKTPHAISQQSEITLRTGYQKERL